jgi:hypothetical protein
MANAGPGTNGSQVMHALLSFWNAIANVAFKPSGA